MKVNRYCQIKNSNKTKFIKMGDRALRKREKQKWGLTFLDAEAGDDLERENDNEN
jgi:hypothetical protein